MSSGGSGLSNLVATLTGCHSSHMILELPITTMHRELPIASKLLCWECAFSVEMLFIMDTYCICSQRAINPTHPAAEYMCTTGYFVLSNTALIQQHCFFFSDTTGAFYLKPCSHAVQ